MVFFGLKGAYHGTLRITREPLRDVGLTPARFDQVYAVVERPGGVLQSVLRRILGVCRATVSKMLISLETGYGRHSIRDAKRDSMRSGSAELAFATGHRLDGALPLVR